MTRGGVSAKMKNKNTWSIPDIAALADYFGVPVTSLLDDTLMRQMLGEELRCIFGGSDHRAISCSSS